MKQKEKMIKNGLGVMDEREASALFARLGYGVMNIALKGILIVIRGCSFKGHSNSD
jgi:hypothetical protein